MLGRTAPGTIVFSPKGWEFSAQGNALGSGYPNASSLKGWDSVTCLSPSGWGGVGSPSQGVALG